eukprot:5906436-Amphidinium_carterae.1
METSSDASAAIWSLQDTPLLWERTLLFDVPAITGAGMLGPNGCGGNSFSPNPAPPKQKPHKSKKRRISSMHLRLVPQAPCPSQRKCLRPRTLVPFAAAPQVYLRVYLGYGSACSQAEGGRKEAPKLFSSRGRKHAQGSPGGSYRGEDVVPSPSFAR